MILSRMTAVGTDGSRVMLWFDDGSKMRVPTGLVAEFGLYGGMTLDEEDLSRLMDRAQQASAKSRAVRIVSAAAVSERELERRLVRKGERPEDAREAAKWLHDIGALDDRAVAAGIVSSCIRKGYGSYRIRQELTVKGIPREVREEVLEALPDLSDGVDTYLARKLKGTAPDAQMLQKLTGALLRRGFSRSEVSAGIRRYREGLEDTEETFPEFDLFDE